jgi:N4-gp56 family major capsid protein
MGETTKSGDISQRTNAYAAAKLLERGQYDMVIERFGQAKPLKKNHSMVVKFRRYESLRANTAPLSEGIPPAGQKLNHTDVTATLQQYGDFTEITDVIQDTHEDPVLMEAVDLCGEEAAEVIERVRISHLKGGSNVFYANNVSGRSSVNSGPLRGDLRKIERHFRRYKGREISSIVKASAKISTEPIEPSFIIMGHTDLAHDFREMDGFVPWAQYSDSDKRMKGELGKVDNFRIILTALFEPWEAAGASGTTYLSGRVAVTTAASCDVYPVLVCAKNSYGIVPLQGAESVKVNVVNPNKINHANKLGQTGFVSWKTYQTACILNNNWIARYEVAATANPST